MSARDHDQVALRLDQIVVLYRLVFRLLQLKQPPEGGALEVQKAHEVTLVGGQLVEDALSLRLQGADHEVVARHDVAKLLDHRVGVRLIVPLVIPEVVDVIVISRPVHLHSLQEDHELLEIWLSIDAKHI